LHGDEEGVVGRGGVELDVSVLPREQLETGSMIPLKPIAFASAPE
jgi:hypothetical protein